ncbi:hypothetical protein FE391_42580 [Nonomuraea sp. KC401]|uniref:hypothetical protein n=1 Tax=unclassified Nonomuraea TaxID=2593643 RepID=UPI0010FD764A|nr:MULTISPECIES: hypothetical protein [unclassified Nonomuraea]NBF00100.1 hypothetical protein [Nonomuraea sp. K271]TLF53945.1 hypothetical protein FE391_42580 [Nonomuraea sp. KC401]
MNGHPIMVVVDPSDDVACVNTAWGAHDPAAGVIAVHPTPGATGIGDICLDVLAALGKPIDQAATLIGAGGREKRISHAATAWTLAERIWHIIVLRAHLLTRRQRARLIELGHDTDAVVTVVWHAAEPPEWAAELPGNHGWKIMTGLPQAIVAARFARKPWRAAAAARRVLHCTPAGQEPSPHADGDAQKQALPPLPTSDFPFFRADAYRSLGPFMRDDDQVYAAFGFRGFEVVDAVYGYGMDMACTWILDQDELGTVSADAGSGGLALDADGLAVTPSLSRSAMERPAALPPGLARHLPATGPEQLESFPHRVGSTRALRLFLADLVADCPTREHAIARIRGAQAGFFLHGLLLAVPALLDRATGRGLMARLDADHVERIRARVVHPVHAAALAALLCTGADPADLAVVPASALDAEGATIEVTQSPVQGFRLPGESLTFGIPEYARSLMIAARHFHQLCGHDASEPLLGPGIGRDNQHLIAVGRLAGVTIPALVEEGSGQLPWDLRTVCWRIGEALHRREAALARWSSQAGKDDDV